MKPLYPNGSVEDLPFPIDSDTSLMPTMCVEIFKTNVEDLLDAHHLVDTLQKMLPECKINFDLQDSDRILRIAGAGIQVDLITSFMNDKGYTCILLN